MHTATWKTAGFVALLALATTPLVMKASTLPQTAAAKTSDEKIDERIENRVKLATALKGYDIDVKVNAGVVMLKGTVRTQSQKDQAGRLANVTGVSKVDNQIAVDPAAHPSTMSKIEDGAKVGAEKTKDGVVIAAEKTKDGLSKSGEVITDAWITARVKTDFIGEDLLKGSDINADTDNHVVTLKGTVPTMAGRTRAMAITKTIEGVTRVVNQMTIGPKK